MSTTPGGDQIQLSSGRARHLPVNAAVGGDLPLDAGEIDAPLLAFGGRTGVTRVLGEGFPREGDFNGPALISIGGIIQRAIDVDGGFRAGNLPRIVRLALIHIRLAEQQVPGGIERVHLELVIGLGIARRIDEHLKVRVLENDGVMVRKRGPNMRLFEFRGEVEILVVPKHLCARAKPGLGPTAASDVHEISRPRRLRPSGLIQVSIDQNWGAGVAAEIASRNNGLHFIAPRIAFTGAAVPNGNRRRQQHHEENASLLAARKNASLGIHYGVS